jgi:checkpoint serine/threonine-protein kinase
MCTRPTNTQADCLPDPSDVFLYLEDQGIGQQHALLYEAYATYLELRGAFSQAELVYQEGVNRCVCVCVFVRACVG